MSAGDNFSLFENLQIINENATDMAETLGLSHWLPVLPSGGDGGGDVFGPSAQQLFLCSCHLRDLRTTVNISFHPEIELLCSLFFLKGSPLKLGDNNEKVYIYKSLFFSIYTQIN